MNNLLRGLAFGCLYLTTHALLAAEPSSRVAMVVGIGSYPDAPLKNPVSDAKAVREILTGSLGFEQSDVMYCENPTRLDLLQHFEDFKTMAAHAEIVLFYYAGHGMENIDGNDNYLIPVDAPVLQVAQSEAVLKAHGLNVMGLSNEMAESSQGAKIWLLDCCRERPAARSIGGAARAGGGLAHYEDGRIPADTLFMFASSPRLLASDGLERGPFTEALLEVLPGDTGNLMEIFFKVSDRLDSLTQGQQKAWVRFEGAGGILRAQSFLSGGSNSSLGVISTGTSGVPGEKPAFTATSPAPTSMAAKRAELERAKKARALTEMVDSAPTIPLQTTPAVGQPVNYSESSIVTAPIVLNKLTNQVELNSPKDISAPQSSPAIVPQPNPAVANRGLQQQPSSSYPTNQYPANSYQPNYNLDDTYEDSYDDKASRRAAAGRAALGVARRFLGF